MRSSQCPQVKGRGKTRGTLKSKKGTRGTRKAKQEHMRGITGGQKMRTAKVHEMNNGGTTEALHRTENT